MTTELDTVVETATQEGGTGSETQDKGIAAAPTEGEGVDVKATPEPPAYAPNFKYKVHGQEKEFDEWIRQSIKDAETEKRVRDLYTRADGIEHVKQDRERLAQDLETFRTEKEQFDESLKQLSYYVQTDDLQSFFDALKIPKEQVLRFALREVQFSENPQLRAQYEQQRQAARQSYQQQIQGERVMTQYEQAAVQLRGRELDFALRQPDTQTVAESFDNRVGRPGAFRDEVILRGQLHFQTKGIDTPVDDLVKEVIQVYGLSQTQAPQMQVPASVPGKPGVVQGSQGKPVIPSIPGSGQSAVKKQIKGIAGLKERYAELTSR